MQDVLCHHGQQGGRSAQEHGEKIQAGGGKQQLGVEHEPHAAHEIGKVSSPSKDTRAWDTLVEQREENDARGQGAARGHEVDDRWHPRVAAINAPAAAGPSTLRQLEDRAIPRHRVIPYRAGDDRRQ